MIISDNTQIVLNIGYILGLIGFVWKVATDQSKMKNDIKDNKDEIKRSCNELADVKDRVTKTEEDHVASKVALAEIRTELTGIKAGITEIKIMFKEAYQK